MLREQEAGDRGSMQVGQADVTRDRVQLVFTWGTGASLELEPPSFPLETGGLPRCGNGGLCRACLTAMTRI